MSDRQEIEEVRAQEQARVGVEPITVDEKLELTAYASLRPRHPFLRGPWRPSREADLAGILVQHSED
jgi:hypothetical protein